MTGKDTVMYLNGQWEQYGSSGAFKEYTKMYYIIIAVKVEISNQ